jgi:RimJ/RimL family protein N-acetyltransferase
MKIDFRPVTRDDIELLIAWRANPDVYEGLYEQNNPYEWERFYHWWTDLEHSRDWIIMVYQSGIWRDVGVIRVLELDTDVPEIGVYVGEVPLWGAGVGSDAVRFALEWLRDAGYSTASACILETNDTSISLFERLGFTYFGQSRENELEYRISLD